MIVAYLVNQYPQPSHSFIRREIAALEKLGITTPRFTLRASNGELVDPRDRAEAQKARVVLSAGAGGMIAAMIATLFSRPTKFVSALRLAFNIGRRSERGLFNHLMYFAEACVLRRWLADAKVEHIHAHFGTNSTAVAMLTAALGGPTYSFTCHGPEEFDKVMAIRLDEKIRRAKFVVGISEYGRSQLFRWCDPATWDKIKVVHCGVDEVFLQSQPLPPPPSEPRLICVGRLVPQKGQMILLEAAAKVVATGIDLKLTLAGDGMLRQALERRIAELDLGRNVTIAGWMSGEQIRQAILNSRAMVLPSFAEGLPVVLMEALALERPVITTQVAGIPELVKPGISGWLVSPGTAEPLADAMRDALTEPTEKLHAMGQAGAALVRQHHSADIEAARLAELFSAAVS